jgi:CRP-like cAMP-binding protein
VLTGTVCLHKGTTDGRRQVIDFLVAGDCFTRYTYSVEAITRSTLVRAARATLAAAVREQPGMAERLIERAAAELARAHEQMLLLGRKNAQEKIASLLVDLARRLGANPTGPAFRLPISRQEMADQLGLTIETVSRTMTRLKEGASSRCRRPTTLRCSAWATSQRSPKARLGLPQAREPAAFCPPTLEPPPERSKQPTAGPPRRITVRPGPSLRGCPPQGRLAMSLRPSVTPRPTIQQCSRPRAPALICIKPRRRHRRPEGRKQRLRTEGLRRL